MNRSTRLFKGVFWISLILFFVCVNTLAAVLYTGVEALDKGTGFISLSPLADCIFWGSLMLIFGAAALLCSLKIKPSIPPLPRVLRFPAGYLASLAVLSTTVLFMGILQLLDRFSVLIHLPFWGYVLFLAAAYPVCGYISCRRLNGRWTGALWGLLFAAVFCGMAYAIICEVNAIDAAYLAQMTSGHYGTGYTERLMGKALGAVLGRINLPACVLMGNYEYAYYDGVHTVPRDLMAYLVCACPPILFSLGWSIAVIREKFSKKSEKGDHGI